LDSTSKAVIEAYLQKADQKLAVSRKLLEFSARAYLRRQNLID